MAEHAIYKMAFSKVYPYYIEKAENKGRTKEEVHEIICWLTGYTEETLKEQIKDNIDFKTFFNEAPCLNESRNLIKGTVCGVKIENIEEELMKEIRYLDKLVDELAKGKSMEKILRSK